MASYIGIMIDPRVYTPVVLASGVDMAMYIVTMADLLSSFSEAHTHGINEMQSTATTIVLHSLVLLA